jgi:hypothetical protein
MSEQPAPTPDDADEPVDFAGLIAEARWNGHRWVSRRDPHPTDHTDHTDDDGEETTG